MDKKRWMLLSTSCFHLSTSKQNPRSDFQCKKQLNILIIIQVSADDNYMFFELEKMYPTIMSMPHAWFIFL